MHAVLGAETLSLTLSGEKVRGNFHLVIEADHDSLAIEGDACKPTAHLEHWADDFAIGLELDAVDEGRSTFTRALHVDTLGVAISAAHADGQLHLIVEAEPGSLSLEGASGDLGTHLAHWADRIDLGLELADIDDGRRVVTHALHVDTLDICGVISGESTRGNFHLVGDAEPGSLVIHGATGKPTAHLAQWTSPITLSLDLDPVDDGRSIATRALYGDTLGIGIAGLPILDHKPRGFPAALHNLYRTRLPSE